MSTLALDPVSHHPELLGDAASSKQVLLLKPRGFCAGVVRAVDIVKIALDTFGAPIYVRKEIVHNSYVVDDSAPRKAQSSSTNSTKCRKASESSTPPTESPQPCGNGPRSVV